MARRRPLRLRILTVGRVGRRVNAPEAKSSGGAFTTGGYSRDTMTTPIHLSLAAGHQPVDLDSLQAALADRFVVEAGSRTAVRRAGLDTFDLRLAAAGLVLERRAAAGRESLVLVRADGSTRTEESRVRSWPALADVLPAGALRDEVAARTQIRALMLGAEERRALRRLQLRNGDDKVVVRVEVDEPAGGSHGRAAQAAPMVLTVLPLRGYADEADRALRTLTALGLRPVERAEPTPGPTAPTLDRSAPAGKLLVGALSEFASVLRDNLPGLLDDVDTEFLHDFRVAVRRTRSTLKLGRPALPAAMRSRWEPAFKWLGDLTTPRARPGRLRARAAHDGAAGWWRPTPRTSQPSPPTCGGGAPRSGARWCAGCGRCATGGWSPTGTHALESLADAHRVGGHPMTAGELADRSVGKAYRRVARGRRGHRRRLARPRTCTRCASGARSCATRSRCSHRCSTSGPARQAVADLKELQDVLGRFQDAEVQRHALRDFADEMMADGHAGRGAARDGRADRAPRRRPGPRARRLRRGVRARSCDRPSARRMRLARGLGVKVLATYNIKGGVGKTSTAVNLAYLAAREGRRTLLWDLDPQAAATFLFRVRARRSRAAAAAW